MKTSISNYFFGVSDPRVEGRCLHLLSDILLLGLCTYVTGETDYQDMHLFGLERGTSLGDYISLPNGVPSADTFERVFKIISAEELQCCLYTYGLEILSTLAEKQIIIDGKKLRGVSPTTKGNKGLYLLNVFVGENALCIAQEKVKDKSNEITAIPQVLKSIDITDAVVSIDAMGTQREIVELIIEKKGHYFLSVKNNQQALCQDIECAFKLHQGYDCSETLDSGHGRIETRKCSILPAHKFLMEETISAWKGIQTIIRINATREVQGKTTFETRYYISDEQEIKAAYFNSLARGHWAIENLLHWHLDVTFKEDLCRTRTGYAPQNLAVLRKWALQIVANQKDKLSLKKRLYKAALDTEYLKKLLGI